jgi:glycosyltransferase involved in cell wall biosynthesis
MKEIAQKPKSEISLTVTPQAGGVGDKTLPVVSIVINNYNYGRFIAQAIDSALNQTYSNTEVVVVDDGSTDNSREIITSYGNRIIPILKANGGHGSTFNAGLAASQGEIIFFLDSDDYLFPDTVERVVAAWKPGVVKVQYRLDIVDTSGNRIGVFPPTERKLDDGDVVPLLLAKGRYGTPVTSGNAFSRDVLDKIGPIPEAEFRHCGESYLVNLAPFYGLLVSIEQSMGAYRMHGNNDWGVTQEADLQKFGKYVKSDLQRYELLANKAPAFGYVFPEDCADRDYLHLRNRIISLRLNPETHPVSSDYSPVLTYKALRAIWLYSELDVKRRLIWSIRLILMGLLPEAMSKQMIKWILVSSSRPRSVVLLLKGIKKVVRF